MCMNCGCGAPDERHHPTDIIREDLQRAADGGGITLQEAARNLQMATQQLTAEQEGLMVESATYSTGKRA